MCKLDIYQKEIENLDTDVTSANNQYLLRMIQLE